MIALIVAVVTMCPLIFGGLAPSNVLITESGEIHAAQYGVYITNPSPFAFSTSRLDLWMKDNAKSAHPVIEDIPKTTIPAHTTPSKAVVVKFTDDDLILNDYIGVSVECDGIPQT